MRLHELAARIGCDLEGDGAIDVNGVATLEDANAGDVSFLSNPRYTAKAARTGASAVIVERGFKGAVPAALLRAGDPYRALAETLGIFHPERERDVGVHATAVVDSSARVGTDAHVGPFAVIGANVAIGRRATIGAHVVISAGTTIGDDFVAQPHACVLEHVTIGDRVTLQSGAVIGGDGFGYVIAADGSAHKLPQAGTVVLEDEVEVGANATVDRATIGATRIRRGAKIDNLVMIAHGCEVGEGCLIAAQTGLAGSTKLGRSVQLGGQVGVAGHLEIGDFARAAAQSGIPNDVPAGATVGGYPATDVSVWRRVSAALPRLPEALRRLRRVERRLSSGDAD